MVTKTELIEKIKSMQTSTELESTAMDGHCDSARRYGKLAAYQDVIDMLEKL